MPLLVKSSRLTPEELEDLRAAYRQRRAQESRTWRHLFQVLPVCHHKEELTLSMARIGIIHLRHVFTGMRWSVQIIEGAEEIFARHSGYMGRNGFTSTVYFDTTEESADLLQWALEVWEHAAREGQMDLPFVPVTSPRNYFHAVDASQRLLPNAYGGFPWSPSVPSPRTRSDGRLVAGGDGAS